MDVTHPQLVSALVKNPRSIIETLSDYSADLWHGATGVAGEGGELLEGLLKLPEKFTGPELAAVRENVVEELGDLFFYIEQIVQRTGIQIDWDAVCTFARNQELTADRILHHGMHVAVYASQVLDTIKKCAIYNKELDIAALTGQLSLLGRHMVTVGYMFGVEKVEALAANIKKLSKRYEGLQYSDAAAQNRADKIERKPFPGEPVDADQAPVTVPHSPPPGNPDE